MIYLKWDGCRFQVFDDLKGIPLCSGQSLERALKKLPHQNLTLIFMTESKEEPKEELKEEPKEEPKDVINSEKED